MNYPAWWNRELTLYNRIEAPDGEIVWRGNQLAGCFLKRVDGVSKNGSVLVSSESVVIRIPAKTNFISAQEWQQRLELLYTTEQNKMEQLYDEYGAEMFNHEDVLGNLFTVQTGDIVVAAPVTDQLNEYEAGKRAADLFAKYNAVGCFSVETVTVNTAHVPAHYKVVAK